MQPYVGAMITPLFSSIAVSSVPQKVISVVFRSRAPKPLYMFICIIQITAGEQQQQPAHSASRHNKNKSIITVWFVDIGDKVISKLQPH